MFHLFGKKKEEAPAPKPEKREPAPLPCGFDGEEVPVLAITGPGGFADREDDFGQAYSALELTAWMEEDGREIHQGSYELAVPKDKELLEYLKQHVPRDFIIKFTARLSPGEDRLLLVSLPAPGFDPDLKAILDQQKAEVTAEVEGLGTFTLNRSTNWFQLDDAPWTGESTVQLVFDRGTEEEQTAAQDTARAIWADVDGWDDRLRTSGAQQLPLDGEDVQELSREELAQRLELESLQVWPDGRFEAWLHDGNYEWAQSVRINGTAEDGPTEVHWEG